MAVSADYIDFVKELFEPFGAVTVRPMFGGAGIFHDGVMFALIAGEALYLKADEATLADFEREGSRPFAYEKNGKRLVMSYSEVPPRLYDDPEELAAWAQNAFDAALRAKRKR